MEFTDGEIYYNKAKQLLQERLRQDTNQYNQLSVQLEDYYTEFKKNPSRRWLENLKALYHSYIDNLPKPVAFYQPRLKDLTNAENLKEFLDKK